MTRILLSIFLSLFYFIGHSQERNDGIFIVHLMETDSEDLKCEIGVTHSHIVSLMNNGRHVISAVPTKFGMIALHEKAKELSYEECMQIVNEQSDKTTNTTKRRYTRSK